MATSQDGHHSKCILRLLVAVLYGVLVVSAFVHWRQVLNPAQLWQDDLWVSVIAKLFTIHDHLVIRPPSPPAFLASLELPSFLLADPEVSMQVVPFLAALLSIVAFGIAAHALTGDRWLGVAGAAMAAMNFPLSTYAGRVKHYTFDFLCVAVLLFLGIRCLRCSGTRNVCALATAGFMAFLFSFASVLMSLALFGTLMAFEFPHARDNRRRFSRILFIGGIFAAVILAWYVLDTRHRANARITQWWSRSFIPWHSLPQSLAFLRNTVGTVVRLAMPVPLRWMAWLIVPGFALLLASRNTRSVGVSLLVFYASVLAANALGLYPLGKERVDMFTYPATLLTVVAAIHGVSQRFLRTTSVNAGIALSLMGCAWVWPCRPTYPPWHSGELLAELERRERPGDLVVLHPTIRYAAAYYSGWRASLVPRNNTPEGYDLLFQKQNVVVPSGDEETYATLLARRLETECSRRILYNTYYLKRKPSSIVVRRANRILDAIENQGYRVMERVSAYSTEILIMEKEPVPALDVTGNQVAAERNPSAVGPPQFAPR